MSREIPLPAVLHILAWEQLRLRAYQDAVGKWTIGWGHLILPGEENLLRGEITRERANQLFEQDLAEKVAGVDRALPGVDLQAHQRGTLVAFTFNSGTGALGPTMGLGRALREGRFQDVPEEMKRWVYGTHNGAKVRLAGLIERREAEARLWEGA